MPFVGPYLRAAPKPKAKSKAKAKAMPNPRGGVVGGSRGTSGVPAGTEPFVRLHKPIPVGDPFTQMTSK